MVCASLLRAVERAAQIVDQVLRILQPDREPHQAFGDAGFRQRRRIESRVGDYYLLDSDYTGFKLTAIAKPSPFLGFTTRYVNQVGKMKVTGYLPTYPAYDSLDSKNHIISESIDAPRSRS